MSTLLVFFYYSLMIFKKHINIYVYYYTKSKNNINLKIESSIVVNIEKKLGLIKHHNVRFITIFFNII